MKNILIALVVLGWSVLGINMQAQTQNQEEKLVAIPVKCLNKGKQTKSRVLFWHSGPVLGEDSYTYNGEIKYNDKKVKVQLKSYVPKFVVETNNKTYLFAQHYTQEEMYKIFLLNENSLIEVPFETLNENFYNMTLPKSLQRSYRFFILMNLAKNIDAYMKCYKEYVSEDSFFPYTHEENSLPVFMIRHKVNKETLAESQKEALILLLTNTVERGGDACESQLEYPIADLIIALGDDDERALNLIHKLSLRHQDKKEYQKSLKIFQAKIKEEIEQKKAIPIPEKYALGAYYSHTHLDSQSLYANFEPSLKIGTKDVLEKNGIHPLPVYTDAESLSISRKLQHSIPEESVDWDATNVVFFKHHSHHLRLMGIHPAETREEGLMNVSFLGEKINFLFPLDFSPKIYFYPNSNVILIVPRNHPFEKCIIIPLPN